MKLETTTAMHQKFDRFSKAIGNLLPFIYLELGAMVGISTCRSASSSTVRY